MSFDGFKKGLKRFMDSLTTPKMNYGIELPKETYFLGEEIEANLFFQPSEHVEIEKAIIRLYCVESVKEIKRVKEGEKTYDKEYLNTARLYDKPLTFDFQPTFPIESGEVRRQPFKIVVPMTGRPTYNSVNSNVVWSIDVELQSRGRRNVARSYQIQVAVVPHPQATQTSVFQKETVTEIEIVYCSHCGTKNNARTQYCTSCHAPLH